VLRGITRTRIDQGSLRNNNTEGLQEKEVKAVFSREGGHLNSEKQQLGQPLQEEDSEVPKSPYSKG